MIQNLYDDPGSTKLNDDPGSTRLNEDTGSTQKFSVPDLTSFWLFCDYLKVLCKIKTYQDRKQS